MSANKLPSRDHTRHPFRKRENFPNLDFVFYEGPSTVENSNVSICSNSSCYSLDMSIGARAALTDHLRHISKYGVDDESAVKENDEYYSSKDRIWNKLLDDSQSFTTENQQHCDVNHTVLDTESKTVEVSSSNDSIFFSNDTSSDFFNSSRVHLLKTPDRNKNRVTKAFSRKEEQELNEYEEEEEEASIIDQSASRTSPIQGVAYKFCGSIQLSDFTKADTESSFSAFTERTRGIVSSPKYSDNQENPAINDSFFTGAMDVSRISAIDSVCTPQRRGSPGRNLWDEGELEDPWSPFNKDSAANNRTPSYFAGSWCTSASPRRSPLKTLDDFTQHKSISNFLSPLESQAASLAKSRMSSMTKEKPKPFHLLINSRNDEIEIIEKKNPFLDFSLKDHCFKNIRPPSPISTEVAAIEMNSVNDLLKSILCKEGIYGSKG